MPLSLMLVFGITNMKEGCQSRDSCKMLCKKPHLYTKGGEKQYKDYEKNYLFIYIIKAIKIFFTGEKVFR